MKGYLLDVNVLVALSWPEHVSYGVVRRWFALHSARGWATCPIVEAGFVRVISNPAFSVYAVSVEQAVRELRASVKHEAHQFWADSISFPDAMKGVGAKVSGYRQTTEAYLVALALHNHGKLATLDRGIAQFAPAQAVEVIA